MKGMETQKSNQEQGTTLQCSYGVTTMASLHLNFPTTPQTRVNKRTFPISQRLFIKFRDPAFRASEVDGICVDSRGKDVDGSAHDGRT